MKLKSSNNGSPIAASIFESFNKLTSDDEKARIKGASGLIKCLEETDEDKVRKHFRKMCLVLMFKIFSLKVQKQLDYTLKRLIRGNGSSASSSRIGFHTALTGLLSSKLNEPPKISNIIEIVKKEFHSAEEKGKVDSMVGTTLVCGAIIRSENALGNATREEIEEVVKCLSSCLTKPSVSSLAFSFLNDLVAKVSY